MIENQKSTTVGISLIQSWMPAASQSDAEPEYQQSGREDAHEVEQPGGACAEKLEVH